MEQLLPDERKQLQLALSQAFPKEDVLELLVFWALNLGINEISPPAIHPLLVMRVIRRAEADGTIEDLIREARQQNKDDVTLETFGEPILERLARRRAAAWYAAKNPYNALFISEPRDGAATAFISREQLRKFLENLGDAWQPRVLVVNGDPKTGKSYSLEFITYLCQELRPCPYQVASIDLDGDVSLQPESVVTRIALQLGWPVESIPPRQPTAARYAKILCDWLQGRASLSASPVVLVLDDFHEPGLHTETRELVSEMIIRVSSRLVNARLVLLNYMNKLVPSLQVPVAEETLGPLTPAQIRAFFADLHKQIKGAEAESEAINQIVSGVLERATSDEDPMNKALNKWTTEAALKLG